MSSILRYLKQIYYLNNSKYINQLLSSQSSQLIKSPQSIKLSSVSQQLYGSHNKEQYMRIFNNDCIQRIGKQYISMVISISLIKCRQIYSNRDISISIKRLQQQLIIKLNIQNKKYLYKIFGYYYYYNHNKINNINNINKLYNDSSIIQFQLTYYFFHILSNLNHQNNHHNNNHNINRLNNNIHTLNNNNKNNIINNKKINYNIYNNLNIQHTLNINNNNNNISSNLFNPIYNKSIQSNNLLSNHIINHSTQSINQSSRSNINIIQSNNINTSKQNQSQYNQSSSINQSNQSHPNQSINTIHHTILQNQTQDNFIFQLTKQDLSSNTNNYSQHFFLTILAHLQNLSSPQGQLTYIWQHLKFKQFQTIYQPFMNEQHQWICKAKIIFPHEMYHEKYLQRTQTSRNKRKARQLACTSLLKSLYLQYPEIWMFYKHIKQQKKLTISPLDQPKDFDQLAIIADRKKFKINHQKIQQLFKHNFVDIIQMMEKISAKAQLNTLLQQLPGRVTSPKLQKKYMQGNWLVPVRIQYRTANQIENNIPPKVYQKNIIWNNSKVAQEQAYMQALINLYSQNPQLLQKIQSIKLAKGIKDAQKKLPLLRTLKQQSITN